MFGSRFAEYSIGSDPAPRATPPPPRAQPPPPECTAGGGRGERREGFRPPPPPPQRPSAPRRAAREGFAAEGFAAEGVITTLDALSGADTSTRTVALKLESEMTGKEVAGHEETAMNAALEDWMRITHHVMDYQYVHDMNSYVKAVQEDERTRLDRQFNAITNDVMTKKNMYMMRERDSRKLQSRVRILMHSMLFVSAFAFLYTMREFFGYAGFVGMGILSFAFGIYLVMYVKLSASRRYNDWDAMYFNDGRDVAADTPVDDPNPSATCEATGNIPYAT